MGIGGEKSLLMRVHTCPNKWEGGLGEYSVFTHCLFSAKALHAFFYTCSAPCAHTEADVRVSSLLLPH